VKTVNETERSRALEVLEGLYDECGEAVYRYALGMLGTREDAEDLVQTVWLRLVRQADRLSEIRDIKAYVWTAARNQVKTVYRTRGRDRLVGQEPKFLEQVSADENPEIAPDEIRDMERAVRCLARKHREVVLLVGIEGLTLDEAAGRLGIPRGTVASRYRAAVKKMRKILKEKDSS
jgi:RNA polymerase sigma-70 factor (ECF subfamily)